MQAITPDQWKFIHAEVAPVVEKIAWLVIGGILSWGGYQLKKGFARVSELLASNRETITEHFDHGLSQHKIDIDRKLDNQKQDFDRKLDEHKADDEKIAAAIRGDVKRQGDDTAQAIKAFGDKVTSQISKLHSA